MFLDWLNRLYTLQGFWLTLQLFVLHKEILLNLHFSAAVFVEWVNLQMQIIFSTPLLPNKNKPQPAKLKVNYA